MISLEDIQTGNLSSERREFLRKSGAFAIMSMFGVSFFTSCSEDETPSGNNTNPPSGSSGITVNGNQITVDLDVATALANTGGWALVSQAKVLIVNVGSSRFNALTSICTHSGCDNNWAFGSNVFTCRCHNSRFSTDGSVLSGPALQPLRSYQTEVNGRILTVDLG
ncbi:ubiquinol-cytochrome c reductase iron-sulfur subunit [Shivajiella indica]|uniref:Ubiquinol-cytochrome c reductase iron-sulfur subunit n=1 Tax=Shivajiella indica TaxID=872115 RepID=A0ABW5B7A5_9BACT